MEKLNVYFPTGDHYRAAQVMDSARWTEFQPPVQFDAVGSVVEHGYVRLSNAANDPEAELIAFGEALTFAGMLEAASAIFSGMNEADDVDCGDPDCPRHGNKGGLGDAFGMTEFTL